MINQPIIFGDDAPPKTVTFYMENGPEHLRWTKCQNDLTGLRNAMECACNALADSTDANTLLWVAKMRKFLRDGE